MCSPEPEFQGWGKLTCPLPLPPPAPLSQILQMTCLVLSGLWSLVIYGASSSAWSQVHQGQQYAACLAVISFVLSWLVVSFFAALLLNVIDAVFICFAMVRLVLVSWPEEEHIFVGLVAINCGRLALNCGPISVLTSHVLQWGLVHLPFLHACMP